MKQPAKSKAKPTLDHLGDTSSSLILDVSGNDSGLGEKPSRYQNYN
jgi:hypothetical protein